MKRAHKDIGLLVLITFQMERVLLVGTGMFYFKALSSFHGVVPHTVIPVRDQASLALLPDHTARLLATAYESVKIQTWRLSPLFSSSINAWKNSMQFSPLGGFVFTFFN